MGLWSNMYMIRPRNESMVLEHLKRTAAQRRRPRVRESRVRLHT